MVPKVTQQTASQISVPSLENLSEVTRQKINYLLDQAVAHHKAGQTEAAIDLYLKSLELEKFLPDWVYENTIILLSQAGRCNQGLNLREDAVKIHPSSDKVYRALGLACNQQGDLENSIDCYLTALKINQEQPNWLYSSLVEMLVSTKQLPKAIEIGHLGRKFHEDCTWINHHLAEALAAQGNSTEAKSYYTRSAQIQTNGSNTQDRINLAHEPGNNKTQNLVEKTANNLYSQAAAKHKEGQTELALALYLEALELEKNHPAWVYGNAITLLAEASRFELAIEIGFKAEENHPQADEIYRARALVYDRKNNLDRAIELYQKAFDLNPQQPDWCFFYFAQKLLQIEKIKQTLELTKKGLEYYPDYYYLNYVQGDALAKQEKWDEAIAIYLDVQEKKPNLPELAEKITQAVHQNNQLKKSRTAIANSQQSQKLPIFWLTSKATDNIN